MREGKGERGIFHHKEEDGIAALIEDSKSESSSNLLAVSREFAPASAPFQVLLDVRDASTRLKRGFC